MKAVHVNMLIGAIVLSSATSFGQPSANKALTMQDAFELASKTALN